MPKYTTFEPCVQGGVWCAVRWNVWCPCHVRAGSTDGELWHSAGALGDSTLVAPWRNPLVTRTLPENPRSNPHPARGDRQHRSRNVFVGFVSDVAAIFVETTIVTVIACRRHFLRLHRGLVLTIVSITIVVSIGGSIGVVVNLIIVVVILVVTFVIVVRSRPSSPSASILSYSAPSPSFGRPPL